MACKLINGRQFAEEIKRLLDHETLADTAGLPRTSAAEYFPRGGKSRGPGDAG